MENLQTYLPDTSAKTLEPFFAAYDVGNLKTAISDHVRATVFDFDYISEDTILSDIANLEIVIRGFHDDMCEERDAAEFDEQESEAYQDY